jgi:hypothetical protein
MSRSILKLVKSYKPRPTPRRAKVAHYQAFWHLVTADERSVGERLFEPERARYLSWCGAVIGNAGDAAVLQWVYRKKQSSGPTSG